MDWLVPFVDFREQFRRQEVELTDAFRTVVAGGDLIMRQQLFDFEENLASFVGTKYAVGVSNCTDAIRLVAHALDVGAGDEVVTVAHTFVATLSPFMLRAATPVLVDIGPDHNMDPAALASVVNERTRAIVPVHLNGRVCRMDEIVRAAQQVDAVVIEDAAQALGASFAGKNAGSFGRAGVFSFYPAKLLGALGDAGAVVTDDPDLAQQVRLLRDHWRVGKDELGGWGYNCRLDNLQAAILDIRLGMLPTWIERRRALASRYDAALRDIQEVQTLPRPGADPLFHDVYQNYPVLVPERDRLVETLREAGIETLVSWPQPLHKQQALGLSHYDLPVTENLSRSVVSLPLFPELDDWQVDYVAEQVIKFVR